MSDRSGRVVAGVIADLEQVAKYRRQNPEPGLVKVCLRGGPFDGCEMWLEEAVWKTTLAQQWVLFLPVGERDVATYEAEPSPPSGKFCGYGTP